MVAVPGVVSAELRKLNVRVTVPNAMWHFARAVDAATIAIKPATLTYLLVVVGIHQIHSNLI